MKICILIPACNEQNKIAALIAAVKQYQLDIIVVDDGSTDQTAIILKDLRVKVLTHKTNLGKGQALRTGFNYILKKDYDGVIIMDADGQHDPGEIPNFLERANDSGLGIIIGNRMQNTAGMPLVRKLTNIFTSYVISLVIGCRVWDSQCGFRLIKREVLKKLNLCTINYDTESEILIDAARNKFKIISIPVKTIYNDQISRIHPVIDTVRFFNLICRNLFKKKSNEV